MFKNLILIVSIVVLVFNVLNVDYNKLLDINKNKVYYLNSFVCILMIIYLFIYKDGK